MNINTTKHVESHFLHQKIQRHTAADFIVLVESRGCDHQMMCTGIASRKTIYFKFMASLHPMCRLRNVTAITLTWMIFSSIAAMPVRARSSQATQGCNLGAYDNSTKTSVSAVAGGWIQKTSTASMNETLQRTSERKSELTKKRRRNPLSHNGKASPTTKQRSAKTSTILRLQNEWKQMILSGVAYDWYNQKPIRKRKRLFKINCTDVNNEMADQSLMTSHIWIGPITKHQWYVWHFTFTCHDIGSSENDNSYYNGVYHGRIVLSKDYPLRPPISIQLCTPNGRFLTNRNICFTSITHYHPDQWNTNSNIYSMVESLRYHMITSKQGNGEIGAISYSSCEQKQLHAANSQTFRKYVPINYRPSTHAKHTKTIVYSKHRHMIIIDHAEMIRMGYVKVPRSVSAGDLTTADDAITQQIPMAKDGQVPCPTVTTSFTRTYAHSSTINDVTTLSKRNKKRRRRKKKKIEEDSIAQSTKRRLIVRRRQWNILNYYNTVGRYYRIIIFGAATLFTVTSPLHPLFNLCLVACIITMAWIQTMSASVMAINPT